MQNMEIKDRESWIEGKKQRMRRNWKRKSEEEKWHDRKECVKRMKEKEEKIYYFKRKMDEETKKKWRKRNPNSKRSKQKWMKEKEK